MATDSSKATHIITSKNIQLPKRRTNSKKGDNGRLLIIGGSNEYVGAPALAGISALRCGTDSVIIAAPKKTAWAINCFSPDLVTKKLDGTFLSLKHLSALRKSANKANAVLLGTGMNERKESKALIKKFVQSYSGYKVLDALALFAFDPQKLTNAVLLPNAREFERLKEYCDIKKLIKQGNIIVQKSSRARIHSLKGVFKNTTGNPGLTKAGTGDVLAGLVSGFLAQSKDPLQSAVNSVYIIGKTSDLLLRKKKGYFYLAEDLAQEIKDFMI